MITSIFLGYLALGILFALAFVLVGYKKIDPAAESAGFRVRLMWAPAALALWPIVAIRWFASTGTKTEVL